MVCYVTLWRVLTWSHVEDEMAVGALLYSQMLVFILDVQQQAAVPALVCTRHVVEGDPHVVSCVSEIQPRPHGLVFAWMMGVCVSWASIFLTAFVTVGCEEPASRQHILGVLGVPLLGTNQFSI